ncbi:MAG: fimbrillin family protein [Bacteroidales bacterium]|nr:fimbrillin family protein [Bacteroidales bacterium]
MFDKATYRVLAAAALLLAAACAKVEVSVPSEKVPVQFSTYGQRLQTKADTSYVAPGADFAAGSVVGVYGFYHENSTWAAETSAGTNIADFMYHTALTKQSNGTWTYSPIKYWPNEYGTGANSVDVDKLSFWGYYPRNASGLNLYKSGTTTAYDNNTNGLPKISFTQATDPAAQVDLMFTTPLQDLYRNDAQNHGAITNGEVTLVFKHALALVEFQLTEGTGATLNTLDLTNIKRTGTIEDPGTIPFVWSNVGAEYTTHIENLSVHETTLLRLLAVPQTISSDATFTLNYDITFASSDPTHPDPIVYTGDSFSVKLFDNTNPDVSKRYGVTEWEAGKHYIYKITAGLDRIEFEEIVEAGEDWTVGNANISVPE